MRPVCFGVVLFNTSSAALRAEKKLIADGLAIKLIPTPRELSSNCGIALRFDWNHADRVRALLECAHIEFEAIHQLG
jgi:hypothetical protein